LRHASARQRINGAWRWRLLHNAQRARAQVSTCLVSFSTVGSSMTRLSHALSRRACLSLRCGAHLAACASFEQHRHRLTSRVCVVAPRYAMFACGLASFCIFRHGVFIAFADILSMLLRMPRIVAAHHMTSPQTSPRVFITPAASRARGSAHAVRLRVTTFARGHQAFVLKPVRRRVRCVLFASNEIMAVGCAGDIFATCTRIFVAVAQPQVGAFAA